MLLLLLFVIGLVADLPIYNTDNSCNDTDNSCNNTDNSCNYTDNSCNNTDNSCNNTDNSCNNTDKSYNPPSLPAAVKLYKRQKPDRGFGLPDIIKI